MKPAKMFPLFLLIVPSLACQQAKDTQPDPLAEMLATFVEAGIDLDFKAKTLTIEAELGRPDQPLEYLLINPRGKSHEALLITEVKPSLLNAALIALGYDEKGKNARMVEKNPMPSMAEIEKGASYVDIFPPTGAQAWFTISWEEKDGATRDLPVEDLLVDMFADKPVEAAKWIYLGGRMGPPNRGDPDVFLADLSGNLVSICYLEPPNQLLTMSHLRASNEQNWWIDKRVCPKPGSKVRLTIHCSKPTLLIEREKRLAKSKKNKGQADKSP